MSGAGIAARPRYRFCWVCSAQLHGNFHRVVKHPDNGAQVVVHAECAEREGLEVIPGAHLQSPAGKGGDR